MKKDWWVYRFRGWGFYVGLRLGWLRLGASSDGIRDFDLGVELQWRVCDKSLFLKLGWVYLMINVDYTYGWEDDTDNE